MSERLISHSVSPDALDATIKKITTRIVQQGDKPKEFYKSLKVDGKLVTSFLTHPPLLADQCEWDFTKINHDDLLLQKIIFVDVVETKFQCYRSTEKTRKQLELAGFRDIQFINDEARIFPTVIAYK